MGAIKRFSGATIRAELHRGGTGYGTVREREPSSLSCTYACDSKPPAGSVNAAVVVSVLACSYITTIVIGSVIVIREREGGRGCSTDRRTPRSSSSIKSSARCCRTAALCDLDDWNEVGTKPSDNPPTPYQQPVCQEGRACTVSRSDLPWSRRCCHSQPRSRQ